MQDAPELPAQKRFWLSASTPRTLLETLGISVLAWGLISSLLPFTLNRANLTALSIAGLSAASALAT